jgi:hypothetical protein
MNNWTATVKDQAFNATSVELRTFQDFYVSDKALLDRMSELLWFDIYVLHHAFGVSPLDILQSILDLEASEPHKGIKPATRFNKPPLKGLWHKHYFSAHFLIKNIQLGLGKHGTENLVNEVFDPSKSNVITRDMINELSQRIAREPFENRQKSGKITGEWIIFAKHDGKNYYLCASTHDAGDQSIHDRIMKHCAREFPDLAAWMT